MKDTLNRISIPGRVVDLLWADDEFFRDISSHKGNKRGASGWHEWRCFPAAALGPWTRMAQAWPRLP